MDAHRPCPDSALLAAFLDGTLEDYERTAVVSHLADCPACRAVAVTVVEFREVEALDALWERNPPIPPAEPLFIAGATRWSRGKTRAPAFAVAALAVAIVVAIPLSFFFFPSRPAEPSVAALIESVEGPRPLEARLSGAIAYAPPPTGVAQTDRDDRARVQLITTAATLRNTYEEDFSVPSRRAVGVAALLVGDLDDAVSTLEIASSGAPDDVVIANDLAAAYFERSRRANRPDDLPAALSAVERVLYRQPGHAEALFNRALIITALGLLSDAQEAWQAYLARDSQSGWAAEARQRLQSLQPNESFAAWPNLRAAIEATGNDVDVETAVRHHTTAAREYIERDLLRRFVEGVETKNLHLATTAGQRLRSFAVAFARLAGDRTYEDALEVIAASEPQKVAEVAAAHKEFFAAMELMTALKFKEAGDPLMRAVQRLQALDSPLHLRAQIELAATDYYDLRYEQAASRLQRVQSEAHDSRYAILSIRASWLQGMTAFSMKDYRRSRIAYEQMLTQSAASGDHDQWVMANVLLANLHELFGDGAVAWRHRIDAAAGLHRVFAPPVRTNTLVSAAGDALAGEHHAAALLFNGRLTATSLTPNVEVQIRAQRAKSLSALHHDAAARLELVKARERLRDVADESSRLRVEADVLSAEADVLRESDNLQALAAAERALSLPLVRSDQLRRARANLQLATALFHAGKGVAAEQVIADGIAALESFLRQSDSPLIVRTSDSVWNLYSVAARLSLARGDYAQAFAMVERGRTRGIHERKAWAGRFITLRGLQEALPDDVAVTVITQFDESVAVWVIRRDSVASHSVPLPRHRGASLVSAQVRALSSKVARPSSGAELFDLLLRPLEGTLSTASQLVVVADAPYNKIAFAALWDQTRNRYLVEDRAVALAPSATAYLHALDRSAARAAVGTRRASILSGPNTSNDRKHVLVSDLSSMYGLQQTRSADAVDRQRLPNEAGYGDIVHVAADVITNNDFPEMSRIIVADEPGEPYSGAIFAQTLGEKAVRANVVTFENAVTPLVGPRGDGSLGFARELIAAGVPVVIGPVANVRDERVDRTWLEFHRHYAAGMRAAESLRRAQIQALNQSDRQPGPWATLTVFGSTH